MSTAHDAEGDEFRSIVLVDRLHRNPTGSNRKCMHRIVRCADRTSRTSHFMSETACRRFIPVGAPGFRWRFGLITAMLEWGAVEMTMGLCRKPR